ncbi:LuxR C-terminal-related transcriptional regulator [Paenibacillus sedimenti]|uniref:HTH luxR-type domain-containing protein n=1 Tax=Paenibacillus sedimenti TaxID=2770274 RepID=A0A926KUU4_9BACL|nr:LuxR C-terminal-related transcriptional regulator [Paenibacillus sedimenti]MBD0382400.1 hypothetical protein [Paenibacillus sedimenti]
MNKEQLPHHVLFTKLSVPRDPLYLVSRERLMEKMSRSLHCKLSLIVAPPGFGKTTMVSDWLRNVQMQAGWISLDRGENDLLRFWGYVIAALEGIRPGVGTKSLSLLQSSMTVSIEHMIALLVNDLFAIPEELVLILDDYHMVESEEVHRSLSYFLERIPGHIHLCIISRKFPPFPHGTLRANGQLNEIGIAELKFNEDEITSFWLKQMKEPLSGEQLNRLSFLTEGWIAGIQLASMSSPDGLDHTLNHFSGNHRFIVDYLLEEVFLQLPESIRKFLLQTSILERMNDDLCASVTGIPKEQPLLKFIEQANLFLIPLDGERYWYRYHHLFADFLRSRLKESGCDIPLLHQKAGAWFERHGFTEEAIDHALLANDYERASDLIERYAVVLLRRRELETLSRWFHGMPESIVRRPALLIIQAYTEVLTGNQDRVSRHIEKLERAAEALQSDPHSLMAIRMQEEAYIFITFHAWVRCDYEMVYDRIEQLYKRDKLPEEEVISLLLYDVIEINDGKASLISGFYGFNGKLKKAISLHHLYEAFICKHHLERWHFTAYSRTALSELNYERNDLELAMKYADTAIAVTGVHGSVGAYVPATIVKARIHRANGRPEQAIETIAGAMNNLKREGGHLLYWYGLLHAYLIRCYMENGDIEQVEMWLRNCKISNDAGVVLNQEFEILTLIRVLAAKGEHQEALGWAQKLLEAAKQKELIMTMLDCHLQLTVIFDKQDHTHESMLHMHSALVLGEEEGYLRTFIDEGTGIRDLLIKYSTVRKNNYMPELQSGVSMRYVKELLSNFGLHGEKDGVIPGLEAAEYALTPREREVLSLVSSGLSNKEIADKLVLTVGTVKLHLNRVYGKLEVKSRVQAIQKARQLQLIP